MDSLSLSVDSLSLSVDCLSFAIAGRLSFAIALFAQYTFFSANERQIRSCAWTTYAASSLPSYGAPACRVQHPHGRACIAESSPPARLALGGVRRVREAVVRERVVNVHMLDQFGLELEARLRRS